MTSDTFWNIVMAILAAIPVGAGVIAYMQKSYSKLVAIEGMLATAQAETKGKIDVITTRVNVLEVRDQESFEDRGKLWDKVTNHGERLTALEPRPSL